MSSGNKNEKSVNQWFLWCSPQFRQFWTPKTRFWSPHLFWISAPHQVPDDPRREHLPTYPRCAAVVEPGGSEQMVEVVFLPLPGKYNIVLYSCACVHVYIYMCVIHHKQHEWIRVYVYICVYWLVYILTILKNMSSSMGFGWHPVYEMENNPFMFESTNQTMVYDG